jgi:carbamoyltransferase
VQTVERDIEPLYHRLVSRFHEIAGVPLVLNTSFNGYGEPMVETPADAVNAMHTMGLDALAVGEYLVWKEGTPP